MDQACLVALNVLAANCRSIVARGFVRVVCPSCDCKQVSLDAEGAALIGELFHLVIEDIAPRAVAVGGLTMGADPLATATSVLSFQHPRAACLVRREPKGHGTNQWVESTKSAVCTIDICDERRECAELSTTTGIVVVAIDHPALTLPRQRVAGA